MTLELAGPQTSRSLTRSDLLQAWGYVPTPTQDVILRDDSRYQLVAGGIRGGKSQTAAIKAAIATLEFIALYPDQAAGRVAWLVGPSYELTRAEFSYIADLLRRMHPGVKATVRVDPGEIKVPVRNGIFTIRTKSAADPMSLAMEAPVWTIICEAAQVSQDVYERLVGRTSEPRQRFPEFGWLHMEGTFEGSLGWYPALWNRWQAPAIQQKLDARSFSLPTHSNTHLYPGGENDPEILSLRESMPDAAFKERHLGVPVPPSGRVHAAFDPTVHVRKCDYNPDLPVYLGIDPGYSGQPSTYAVEVAQLVPVGDGNFKQWRVIDEIAMNRFSRPGFSAQDVCVAAMERPWWSNPMKHGAIDIAGRQHNASSENSNKEIWRKVAGLTLFDQPVPVKAGIDRFDAALKLDSKTGEPGLVIDPSAQLLISELGGTPNPFDGQVRVYRWRTDPHGEVTGKVPDDRYCDGIKALTYLMVNVQGYAYGENSRVRFGDRSARIRVRSRRRV